MHFAQAAQYITLVRNLGVPAPGAAQRRHLPTPAENEQIWGALLEKIIPIRGEKCQMKQAGSRQLARRWDLCKAPAPISFTPRTAAG